MRQIESCLISLFYIKPQPGESDDNTQICCLISLFYIKPQLQMMSIVPLGVVLYLYSTSNHNYFNCSEKTVVVVLYLYSTSNHNIYHILCLFLDTYTYIIYMKWSEKILSTGKSTKKIPIAMGLVLIFSLSLPIYERYLNIVYQ